PDHPLRRASRPLHHRRSCGAAHPGLDADGAPQARGRLPYLPPHAPPRARPPPRLHVPQAPRLVPHRGLLPTRVEPLLPARAPRARARPFGRPALNIAGLRAIFYPRFEARGGTLREVTGVDFTLNEEQKLLKKTVREFAESELAPHSREWDEKQEFPRAV